MDEYTDAYMDFVIERYNAAKGGAGDAEIYLERRLDFSKWVPEGFGTADAVIITDGAMEIIDLKYGVGVKVSPENNPQFMLYALGALDAFGFLYDIGHVRLTVFQPRVDNVETWLTNPNELISWGETHANPMALKAFEGVEEYKRGNHCDDGFCRARPICREYADEKLKAAVYEFKNPNMLTDDEIGEVLEMAEGLSKWSKLIKDYATQKALTEGAEFPGWKLVEGKSNRVWGADEDTISRSLAERGYSEDEFKPRSLLTITGIEKLVGKKSFNDILGGFVIKPPGNPTLVPFTDKREAINRGGGACEDFKNFIE